MTNPTTAMTGPRITQVVEPLIELPPSTPIPCKVKTAPAKAMAMPTTDHPPPRMPSADHARSRRRGSADDRQRSLVGQPVERVLHHRRHVLVDGVRVWTRTEPLPQADRWQDLSGDLRGERQPSGQVEHVDAEGRPDRDRQDLHTGETVRPEGGGQGVGT